MVYVCLKKISRMKYIYLLFTILFVPSIALFSGCSDDSITNSVTTTDKFPARTEAELSLNAGASVIPGSVVYVDLENLDAPPDSVNGDTGSIGEDVIPYTYTGTAMHRIKLGAGALFKARLVSECGEVMYQLNAPGDSARVTIPAGKYKLYLTSTVSSDGAYGYSKPVFIHPDSSAIRSGAGMPPQGGYIPWQLDQLLETGKCPNCDLVGAQITGKNLTGADLNHSDLSNAVLFKASFGFANFSGAVLEGANIYQSSFKFANFRGANLSNSQWRYIELDLADMCETNRSRAFFSDIYFFLRPFCWE